jgi:V8-like Glu-specific endopeptidase
MARRKSTRKAKSRLTGPTVDRVREALARLTGAERAGLFPPHIDKVREITSLELQPEEGETYAALLETICGVTDDSQPVEQYDGTLGVTIAFVNAHQGPVGQLQWNNNLTSLYTSPGDVSGVRWCSGTLIANDLFLAAGHCFDQTGGGWTRPKDNVTGATISSAEIALHMHVNFNYQVDPAGNLRPEQSFPVTALVEYRLGGLDFAIVRLGNNPGATFGVTQVSTTDAAVGDMLCIMGHPAGVPKRIEAGPTSSLGGTTISYNDIDTLGGNSGSGILRATDGRLVGVHTNGGCNPQGTGANSGVRITSILAQSPTIQAITAPKLKIADDVGTLKPVDDHITVKFIDDGTIKPIDDGGTFKVLDDGGTVKFLDDGGGTVKAVDDVKLATFDKAFGDHKAAGFDTIPMPGTIAARPGAGIPSGALPFVLSTPHHSMAWAGGAPQAGAPQYEQALAQLEAAMRQGLAQLSQMDAEYRRLSAEYQQAGRA